MKYLHHTYVIVILVFIVSYLLVTIIQLRRYPRKLKPNYFEKKWQELQKLCADKSTWPDAIINADKLLDEALKRRHYIGKSMGERMVAAQRDFKDNDLVWFGHKLRHKLENTPKMKLRKSDVKNALIGFRRALKDLGAFGNGND